MAVSLRVVSCEADDRSQEAPEADGRPKVIRDPACELCLRRDELVGATHVHHVVEIDIDESKALDIDNMQSLCHSCHSRLHARATRGRRATG